MLENTENYLTFLIVYKSKDGKKLENKGYFHHHSCSSPWTFSGYLCKWLGADMNMKYLPGVHQWRRRISHGWKGTKPCLGGFPLSNKVLNSWMRIADPVTLKTWEDLLELKEGKSIEKNKVKQIHYIRADSRNLSGLRHLNSQNLGTNIRFLPIGECFHYR